MSELEKTREYGFSTGESAYYLHSIGASITQVQSWIAWHGMHIRAREFNAYLSGARAGYASKAKRFDRPIMNLHKANMRNLIAINGAALSLDTSEIARILGRNKARAA